MRAFDAHTHTHTQRHSRQNAQHYVAWMCWRTYFAAHGLQPRQQLRHRNDAEDVNQTKTTTRAMRVDENDIANNGEDVANLLSIELLCVCCWMQPLHVGCDVCLCACE